MKKLFFILTVVILLFVIKDLLQSIYDIWQKKDFVTKAEKELGFQKQENQRLKSEFTYVQTPEFIEQEARNKLFMIKEGEQKILIPEEGEEAKNLQSDLKNKNIPNWRQWWELFF